VFDPGLQVAAACTRTAVGFFIVEQARVFFAQAYGFGQPEFVKGSQCSHAASRW
jgi:hypothetical protein